MAEGAGGSKPKAFDHFGIEKEPLGIAGEVAETVSRALQDARELELLTGVRDFRVPPL